MIIDTHKSKAPGNSDYSEGLHTDTNGQYFTADTPIAHTFAAESIRIQNQTDSKLLVNHPVSGIVADGFSSPKDKAQQAGRRFSVSGFSFDRKLRAARFHLYGGPCGTPQGVPVPYPGLLTRTVCHHRLAALAAGSKPVDKEPIMADTRMPAAGTNTSHNNHDPRLMVAQNVFHSSSEHVLEMYAGHLKKSEALAYALVEALKPPSPELEYAHLLAEILYEHCSTQVTSSVLATSYLEG